MDPGYTFTKHGNKFEEKKKIAFSGGLVVCADWCLQVRWEPGMAGLCGFTERELHNDHLGQWQKSQDKCHMSTYVHCEYKSNGKMSNAVQLSKTWYTSAHSDRHWINFSLFFSNN